MGNSLRGAVGVLGRGKGVWGREGQSGVPGDLGPRAGVPNRGKASAGFPSGVLGATPGGPVGVYRDADRHELWSGRGRGAQGNSSGLAYSWVPYRTSPTGQSSIIAAFVWIFLALFPGALMLLGEGGGDGTDAGIFPWGRQTGGGETLSDDQGR